MKLKALLLALVVAGLTASIAVADPGKGKPASASTSTTTTDTHGKSAAHKPACKPAKQFNLVGTLAAPAGADGTFALTVSGGNANGQALKGKQLTIDASHAKVVKQGRKTVADLAAGDRVQAKGKSCATVAEGSTFVASQVVVLGAKGGDDETSSSSSTSTTTPTP